MRKLLVLLVVGILPVAGMASVDALVSPYKSTVLLEPENNYTQDLSLDAGISNPENASYTWHRLEDNQEFRGPQINYSLNRDGWSQNTLRLVVTASNESDSVLITQEVLDRPNISVTASKRSMNISRQDSVQLYSNVTNRFDRTSTGKVNYTWQLGESVFSTESDTEYFFDSNGTYRFRLNVTDSAGLDVSENISVTVYGTREGSSDETGKTPSGGGGSGSGSSGGTSGGPTGGTGLAPGPEPENQDQNSTDKPLEKPENSFLEVEGVSGAETKVLNSFPGKIPPSPGKVYRNLSIEANETERGEISVIFSVERDWLRENSLNASRVSLYRYNSGWRQLDTEEVSYTVNSVKYRAYTPGFSYFAISVDQRSLEECAGNCSKQECVSNCTESSETKDEEGIPLVFLLIPLLFTALSAGAIIIERESVEFSKALPEISIDLSKLSMRSRKKEEVEKQMERIKSKLSNNVRDLDKNELMHNLNRASALINSGQLDEAEKILDSVESDIDR